MDKTEAISRLTFCGECAFWHPLLNAKMLKPEYREYVGYCNKPYEGVVQREKDDFCSRGVKKTKEETHGSK